MAIKISREQRAELLEAVKGHFLDIHDEEIGDLKAGLLLDYVFKAVGPAIYNQAVKDTQAWLLGKVEDLEAEVFEPEELIARRKP